MALPQEQWFQSLKGNVEYGPLHDWLAVSHNEDGTLNGGSVSFLAAASGDTTGATDTAMLQAAIDEADDGATLMLGAGTYWVDTVTIDGKTNLTLWQPSGVLKRIASPTDPNPGSGAMIRVGETSGCTNLTIDLAEMDGNDFAGGSSNGRGIRVRNCAGIKIRGYYHHTWNHAIAFGTTQSTDIDVDVKVAYIGVGYTADSNFNAEAPAGCGVIIANTTPACGGVVTVRNSHDVKGAAAVYVGGCAGLEVHLRRVYRMGYRALHCAGTGTITGLKVVEPDVEDCGAVYESSGTAGDSLYGQGTNALFIANAPATAQDAVISGGKINKCGENAVEGLCIVDGTVTDNTGYRTGAPYSDFGSGIASEAFYPYVGGSRIRDTESHHVGDYGIHHFDATAGGMSDIIVESPFVADAAVAAILFQQDTQGTATGVIVRDPIVKVGSGAAAHGVRFYATAGGSFDSTCRIERVTPIGAFSTAAAALTLSGGGTMSALGPFPNSISRFFQNTGQLPGANSAYMMPFEVADLFMPTGLTFNFNAVDATKHYDVGIYDANGNVIWRLGGGSAVTAVPSATGDVSLAISGVTLLRGQYYLVFACDDGTTTKLLGASNIPAGTGGASRKKTSSFSGTTGLPTALAPSGTTATGFAFNWGLSS